MMWELIWDVIRGGAAFSWYLILVGGVALLIMLIMKILITAHDDYRYRREARERLREELKKEGDLLP